MTAPADLRAFYDLVGAHCEDSITPEQSAQLQKLLLDDADLRRRYLLCMYVQSAAERSMAELLRPSVEPAAMDRADTPRASRSILGFLNRLTQFGAGWRNATSWRFWLPATGFAMALAAVAVAAIYGIHGKGRVPEIATSNPNSANPKAPNTGHQSSPSVGRIARTVGVRWGSGFTPLLQGDEIEPEQQIRIEEGLVEINWRKGAELLLQGPALLTVESDHSVYLSQGRLATRLTRDQAHGFTVNTPQSAVVDEGTEFGVDVAPGGDQSVHVFQGKVQFSASSSDGKHVAERELKANEGARVQAESREVDLVAGAGEGFTRSVDNTGHDPHTVAYWRFEDRPVGTLVPNNGRNSKPVRGTVDCSGNGNDLFTWGEMTAPRFSAEVPAAVVPRTGQANGCALDYSAPLPKHSLSRELYTNSAFSHASPIDLQKISPREWTIEASVNPASLDHPTQTFVARSGDKPWLAVPQRLAISLQKIKGVPRFVIFFCDVDGRRYEAVSSKLRVEKDHWYHVSATSDGRTLKLYVDVNDGNGFVLQATTELDAKGNTALASGTNLSQWTVGRGLTDKGIPGNWFQGFIDEVRISDVARDPDEFLFAARPTAVKSPSLDLVDIVVGGNGLSHGRNRGINPTNGQYEDEPHGLDNNARPKQGTVFLADHKYHRVPSNPFVDGVFVVPGDPKGTPSPVQLDSAGHTYASFGQTRSETSNAIIGIGATADSPARFASGEPPYFAKFGAVDYSSVGHGLISIRNNKGITFDLEAIRRAHRGYRLLAFKAIGGNPNPHSDGSYFSDFWVFVDGHFRFERRKVSVASGEIPIDVALAPSDNFLTLVTTYSGSSIWNNWSMFGDPQIKLIPVQE